ncbi:hypothetical protein SHKM778_57130 [Streptomyces sp. KM77-8]|uniref:Uncharacterized protein n=1 Tax=Streptomyces haneummycinicus TaxID=3074435 RepID=A0AAT9HPD6_9ACTN
MVFAAGVSAQAQFEALEEGAAEGQDAAVGSDGDDVGLFAQLGPLGLRCHRGPAAGRVLDLVDRRLLGHGDVVDGRIAAADVGQVDGLARQELDELPVDGAGTGIGGAVAVVPRRCTERGQRAPDEAGGGIRIAQRTPFILISPTDGARTYKRGRRRRELHGRCT